MILTGGGGAGVCTTVTVVTLFVTLLVTVFVPGTGT
jgi:hypothetical protein